jgi:hypothetical protein
MKKLLLCLCIGLSFGCFGQVDFQELSFEEALKRSYKESKIIFLQFESEDCTQCNEVAEKGLSDKSLSKQVNETFLPLKISTSHPDRTEIIERYNLGKGFGTFFINHNGALLHRFPRTTSRSQDYLTEIDVALNKAGETFKVDELEREFRNGNRSLGFLESLLLKKRSLGLSTDVLLDEYAGLLPDDSLQSTHTLNFLARMAPQLDSKADRMMRRDQSLFHRAWMSMPLQQRVAINNEIAAKGMNSAVEQKSEGRARQVASFRRGTYYPDRAAGERAYTFLMMRYYERTSDSVRYLSEAVQYYNTYYMTISADSIKRVDSLRRVDLIAQSAKRDSVLPDGTRRRYATFTYAPVAQRYAAELNNGAWSTYKRTTDPQLLGTAMQWSERAVEFFETPEVLDTYAHLAYKLGNKDRAIQAMEKAVQLRRKMGYPTDKYEAVLGRISKNLPLEQ